MGSSSVQHSVNNVDVLSTLSILQTRAYHFQAVFTQGMIISYYRHDCSTLPFLPPVSFHINNVIIHMQGCTQSSRVDGDMYHVGLQTTITEEETSCATYLCSLQFSRVLLFTGNVVFNFRDSNNDHPLTVSNFNFKYNNVLE